MPQRLDLADIRLTSRAKLTDYGAASPENGLSKEDERSFALAARAQRGDYDDGNSTLSMNPEV